MRTLEDGTIVYFALDYHSSEVAAGWYLELPNNMGNVMAMVFRDSATEPWKLVLRTRIYKDDDLTVESKDRKRGYKVEAKPETDPAEARRDLVEKADEIFNGMAGAATGMKLYRLADHTSTEDFMRRWAEQPWTHMTQEGPAADAEA